MLVFQVFGKQGRQILERGSTVAFSLFFLMVSWIWVSSYLNVFPILKYFFKTCPWFGEDFIVKHHAYKMRFSSNVGHLLLTNFIINISKVYIRHFLG